MVKCKRSALQVLTDKGRVPKGQFLDRKKWLNTLRLSVKKSNPVVNLTTGIHFFTDKRNVLSHFCDVRFVALEGSENGKVQKVSPKGID